MRHLIPLLLWVLLAVSCKLNTSGQNYYTPPEHLNDGLEVGVLEEVGMDSIHMVKSIRGIELGRYNEIHSVLIYKNEKLVLEEYFSGHQYKWDAPRHHGEFLEWDGTKLHNVMSVTKSITAILVGLAVHNGFIDNVHQSIFDFLPEHQHLMKEGKEDITIEHLYDDLRSVLV